MVDEKEETTIRVSKETVERVKSFRGLNPKNYRGIETLEDVIIRALAALEVLDR